MNSNNSDFCEMKQRKCIRIIGVVLLLFYLTIFGHITSLLSTRKCCIYFIGGDGKHYTQYHHDRWREFIPKDTYIFSVHFIESVPEVRFVVTDLLITRTPKMICCFYNNITMESSCETHATYYRMPEFRTFNRQVETLNTFHSTTIL